MENRNRQISTLGSRATSLVSVCLVLLLLGTAALVGMAGSRLRDAMRASIGFVLVMERECPQATADMLKRRLLADAAVERFSFASADDILAVESESLGDDIVEMLGANPYSGEFDVKLKAPYANGDSVAVLAASYATAPGVRQVIAESDFIDDVDATVRRIGIVLGALALVLLVVSIALINNTVSLSVYGRRFIIHTMKLVGATASFIRRPFVLAAFGGGLCAGAVAAGVLVAARWYLPGVYYPVAALLPWSRVAVVAAALVVLGGVLCGATAFFAANRYLRASYDEMFLK